MTSGLHFIQDHIDMIKSARWKFSLWTTLQHLFWENQGVLNSIEHLQVWTGEASHDREVDISVSDNLVFENHKGVTVDEQHERAYFSLDQRRKAELYRTAVFSYCVYKFGRIDVIKSADKNPFEIKSATAGEHHHLLMKDSAGGDHGRVDHFAHVVEFGHYIAATHAHPAYMILRDDSLQAVVVVVQGTATLGDVKTDAHFGNCWVKLADFGVGDEDKHHHFVDKEGRVKYNSHHPAVHKHHDKNEHHNHHEDHICAEHNRVHNPDPKTMIRVHEGFFKAAHYISYKTFNDVHALMLKKHPNYKSVIITGHSLGAGVAQLVYAMWRGQKVFHDIDHARREQKKQKHTQAEDKHEHDHHPIEVKCYAHANPGMISTHAQMHHLKEKAKSKEIIEDRDELFPVKSFLSVIAGDDIIPRGNYPQRMLKMAATALEILSDEPVSEEWTIEHARNIWTKVDAAQSKVLHTKKDAQSGGALPSGQVMLYLPGPPEPEPAAAEEGKTGHQATDGESFPWEPAKSVAADGEEEKQRSRMAEKFGFAFVASATVLNPIIGMTGFLSHKCTNYIAKLAKLFVSDETGLLLKQSTRPA
ncbi:unnamed protein product [Amoebophrya sp. A120]|nr:unnamed protein product [Amoebophrya sp. A120]|eukprot:GSA120T00021782001.1